MRPRPSGCLALAACVLGFAPASAPARTWTVGLDGPYDFADMQAAIAAAQDGDLVLVRPGTYDLAASLGLLGKRIAVRGEAGAAATTLRLAGAAAGANRASVAVFDAGEGPESVLEGFTLTGGKGTRSCAACSRRGGGVYCYNASPTLKGLVVSGNEADFGGGVYLGGEADPRLEGCVITGSSARVGGGLCIVSGSRASLTGCEVSRNAARAGGGLHVTDASPVLEECKVLENTADPGEEGGGLYLADGSRPVLRGCEVRGNSAGSGGGVACVRADAILEGCSIARNVATSEGGGLRVFQADPALTGCRITGNTAGQGDGGGLYLHFASPSLENCVIASNAAGRGGGVFAWVGEPSLRRCTVSGNEAHVNDGWAEGGGLLGWVWSVTRFSLDHCIVWGNVGGRVRGSSVARYSAIEGCCFEGEGNIQADPLFCGWPRADLHVDPVASGSGDGSPERPFQDLGSAFEAYSLALREGSPCIGAGEGGSDIGADLGTCPGARTIERAVIHVGPGTYDLSGQPLLHRGVSLEGAGPEATVVRGTIHGMQPGAFLAGLTVTGGEAGGVIVQGGAEVELRDLVIRSNAGPAVSFGEHEPCCEGTYVGKLVNCTLRDNAGPGVKCETRASVNLKGCTISGNSAGGILLGYQSSLSLTSCIVWGNAGEPIGGDSRSTRTVAFSCIEGGWPGGTGNIDRDPLFCGWRGSPVIHVDAAAPEGGDGSPERPLRAVRAALDPADYDLALSDGSPCRGAGEGGMDMGAEQPPCSAPGSPARRSITLAPGKYAMDGAMLLHVASLEGAGEGTTVLEGPVEGLGTGAVLARLTVTSEIDGIRLGGGPPRIEQVTVEGCGGAGVVCSGSTAPGIVRCTLQANRGPGLSCGGGSQPRLTDCVVRGNLGGAVWTSGAGARPALRRCTLAGNGAGGLEAWYGAQATLTSCVVWGNAGKDLVTGEGGKILASYSCFEGASLWPGTGNKNLDPRFCGWPLEALEEVHVDSRTAPAGDGSAARPFADFATAIDPAAYSVALSASSPCIGAGEGGETMGADLGVCEAPGSPRRLVVLAPGRYSLAGRSLALGVSLRGAGPDATAIEAPVLGLRTGSSIEDLAVVPGPAAASQNIDGIVVAAGESPRIHRCAVSGMSQAGIRCDPGSAPRVEACWIGENQVGIGCNASWPTIVNCVLAGNWNQGLYAYSAARPVAIHCTVAGSQSPVTAYEGARWTLRSCIVLGTPYKQGSGSRIDATRSLIQLPDPNRVWFGTGNLNADPLFAGPGDYRLLPGSPARDAAPPDAEAPVDIDGRPRPCGDLADLGAYEMGCE
ncbi:MAG: right-handed parallel beta-helix repeat-containing protein, partial [Planctomycetes bacterium]|nr:right-handed parallel beta-helix repeat-containing protein [Planctomycetota bacterium]